MKAALFHKHGAPEVLCYEDVPDKVPGPGEVVVRVRACGVNGRDLWTRQGSPNHVVQLPHILGCEIAGDVEALGPGVTGIGVGDRIAVHPGISCGTCWACTSGQDNLCPKYTIVGSSWAHGGYAELARVPAANVIPLPPGMAYTDAAAVLLVFLTAWHMLVTRAQLRPGEYVLILAAASGVGTAAVQIAKLCGAYVIAAASTDEKLQRVRELGADATINYSERDFEEVTRELTGGRGLDCVVETVGKDTWAKSLRSLRRGGRVVTCGTTSGAFVEQDIRYLYRQHLSVLGSSMGTQREMRTILDLIGLGKLRPVIHRILPLSEAAEAHRILAARTQFGKVLLAP